MDFQHSKHEWDGLTERRAPPPLPAGDPGEPITREYLDAALKHNRHATREFVGAQIADLKLLIQDGFPNGDLASHRKVHEGYIQKAEDRNKFWRNVWEKVATGAIYAALVAIGTAVWQYIKAEARR